MKLQEVVSSIKGFNRECAWVQSIKDARQEIIGWKFEAICGTVRRFLNRDWDDSHGAALAALEAHRHHA